MEFMLSEALPIYSGGLGNVAGDQLKAASDLGVPVVGVGLLYQQGYFRQVIDRNGSQQALFPTTIRDNCRSRRCASRTASGCGWKSRCRATRSGCEPGKCRSAARRSTCWIATTPANFPAHRGITSELYGGGPELRLKQELLLGHRRLAAAAAS